MARLVAGHANCHRLWHLDPALRRQTSRAIEREQVGKQLEKAKELADEGLHADFADKLNAAAAQVHAHVDRDSDAYDQLLGKVQDLKVWQGGLE